MGKYDKPRLTQSAKESTCSVCGKIIKKGSVCWVKPKEKTAYHTQCKNALREK
jgi:hypothetical protein